MDKIFDNFFNQAKTGRIKVDDFYFNIKLEIKEKELLYEKLKEFISLFDIKSDSDIFFKLVYLFSNPSLDDLEDLPNFVSKYINFQKNKLNDRIISFLDYEIKLEFIDYNVETPYCLKATITDGISSYELPLVSFGISNNICYIYTVQDKNKDKTDQFSKKIKRLLYKINGNVIDNSEYYKYKDTDYYPENISDVSPSAILVLTLLLNEISLLNIGKIIVVPFLPIRYEAKKVANNIRLDVLSKKIGFNELDSVKKNLELEQLRIQNNLTQKFIRNFFRICYHFDNISVTSYPMELDPNLHIKIKPFENDIFVKLGLEKKEKSM